MTEIKTKKVTFDASLPRGTCATFTHEGQHWIAYPQDKVDALRVVVDSLLGCINLVREDLLRWINDRPEDATRMIATVARTNRVEALVREKAQAWTM